MLRGPWTIAVGDAFHFDIERVGAGHRGIHSNEYLNGTFATKLEAVEEVISGLEGTLRSARQQMARAKRMRRAILKKEAAK